jgi:prophage regulatory protein
MNEVIDKPQRRSRARAAAALPVQPLIVDRATAAAMLSVSERTLEELVRTGVAPQPRQLSANRVGWRVRDLEEFAAGLPASQVLPPRNTGRRAA